MATPQSGRTGSPREHALALRETLQKGGGAWSKFPITVDYVYREPFHVVILSGSLPDRTLQFHAELQFAWNDGYMGKESRISALVHYYAYRSGTDAGRPAHTQVPEELGGLMSDVIDQVLKMDR